MIIRGDLGIISDLLDDELNIYLRAYIQNQIQKKLIC